MLIHANLKAFIKVVEDHPVTSQALRSRQVLLTRRQVSAQCVEISVTFVVQVPVSRCVSYLFLLRFGSLTASLLAFFWLRICGVLHTGDILPVFSVICSIQWSFCAFKLEQNFTSHLIYSDQSLTSHLDLQRTYTIITSAPPTSA